MNEKTDGSPVVPTYRGDKWNWDKKETTRGTKTFDRATSPYFIIYPPTKVDGCFAKKTTQE